MTSTYIAKTLVDSHQEELTQTRGADRGWRWRRRQKAGVFNSRTAATRVDEAIRRPLGSPHH